MGTGCFKVLWCFDWFSKSPTMRIWDDLPEDILDKILNEIVLLSDFIRFGAVCKTWFNVFSYRKRHRIERYNNEVPLLFFPPACPHPIAPSKRFSTSHNNIVALQNQFFNILETKCYDYKSPVEAPPLDSARYCMKVLSASFGWLSIIIKNEEHLIISLKNPISGHTISLPPILVSEHYGIKLVALSCNPSMYPDKCVVAYKSIFHTGFMRVCGKTWNICHEVKNKIITSILFHKGKWYLVDCCLGLVSIDCYWERSDPDKCDFQICKIVERMSSSEIRTSDYRKCDLVVHLVEPESGELLMIGWSKSPKPFNVFMCELVITYDEGNKKMKGDWVRIHRLCNGDEVLFLNDYADNVMCFKSMNLRPDSVYFNTYEYDIGRIVTLNEEMQVVRVQILGAWSTNSEPLWMKQVLP